MEHHRIYYFHANGKEALYLSSADWMDRNLFRRIEVAFPVLDKTLKQKAIYEGLHMLLKDKSAWIMNSNGTYRQSKGLTQNVPPSGQENLLLKYDTKVALSKRKVKA